MHAVNQHPAWDTLLIAIPFFVILFLSVFGTDLFRNKKRKRNSKTSRTPAGVDKDGNPILTDPDGRPWKR